MHADRGGKYCYMRVSYWRCLLQTAYMANLLKSASSSIGCSTARAEMKTKRKWIWSTCIWYHLMVIWQLTLWSLSIERHYFKPVKKSLNIGTQRLIKMYTDYLDATITTVDEHKTKYEHNILRRSPYLFFRNNKHLH